MSKEKHLDMFSAMYRITLHDNFRGFVSFLEEQKNKYIKELIKEDEPLRMAIIQGRIRQIEDIVGAFDTAKTTADKIRSNTDK